MTPKKAERHGGHKSTVALSLNRVVNLAGVEGSCRVTCTFYCRVARDDSFAHIDSTSHSGRQDRNVSALSLA